MNWKAWMYFTRNERNGIIVLLFFMGLLYSSSYWLSIFHPQTLPDFSALEAKTSTKEVIPISLTTSKKSNRPKSKPHKKETYSPKVTKPQTTLFNFDPNHISKDQLLTLGFPEKVASRLLNYRTKGGTFKKKEDLGKIYGLDESLYQKLLPFIQITVKEQVKKEIPIKDTIVSNTWKKDKKEFTPKKKIILDINIASASDFQSLYGIGPVLSERIVKFREALGGFVAIDQVGSIYGLADSIFQELKPQLTYTPIPVQQMDINHLPLDSLKKHPYIDYKTARAIVNYRTQHGLYRHLDDLLKIHIIKKELLEMLGPYIAFKENQ